MFLFNCCIFFRPDCLLHQCCSEFGHKQRFGYKRSNSCFFCFLRNIRPVIRSKNDDRCVISDHFSYPSDCFDTIHIRHLPVDNICFEFFFYLAGFFCTQYSFFTGSSPVCQHFYITQHLADTHTGIGIVIHNQCSGSLQFRNRFVFYRFAGNLTFDRNNKLRTFSDFTVYRDGSSHHIDNVFGDCHSKTGSLDPALCNCLFSRKCIKDMLLKFF